MDFKLKKENGFEYVELGNGPVLLLLHGLFGALSNWKSVLTHFSGQYTVVIPMMPIFNLPLLKTNVGGLAKFIHSFVEFKQYDKVTVLGNSLGGHVALIYVLDHPERVESLILTGSSGLYENAFGGSFPKRGNYDFIKERVEFTFYDPKTATKELVDEVFDMLRDNTNTLKIVKMAKSAIKHNLAKEIEHIKIPVGLIWGKDDNITPPDVAEEFHRLIPNSELYWIDKCGHAPMMEHPELFNKIVDGFLDKHLHLADNAG